jgi:hypothetical protein
VEHSWQAVEFAANENLSPSQEEQLNNPFRELAMPIGT